MIKRVNFTGRRRIGRRHVQIDIHEGSPPTFDAAIDLDGTPMPAGARVYLEAMCAGSPFIKRFCFGAVGAIAPPQDRRLTDVDPNHAFFALKVVDQSKRAGRILGIAENIRPQLAGGKNAARSRGILPIVESNDLGQQLWDIHYGEHDVCLRVNAGVPGLKDRVRWDPLLYGVLYPAVVRQILARAIDSNSEFDESSDRWPVLWLRFGKNLHPDHESPPSQESDLEDECHGWIEEVVGAFCAQHTLRDSFLKHLPDVGGES